MLLEKPQNDVRSPSLSIIVAIWVAGMPCPGCLDDGLDIIKFWLPSEDSTRFLRGCDQRYLDLPVYDQQSQSGIGCPVTLRAASTI